MGVKKGREGTETGLRQTYRHEQDEEKHLEMTLVFTLKRHGRDRK